MKKKEAAKEQKQCTCSRRLWIVVAVIAVFVAAAALLLVKYRDRLLAPAYDPAQPTAAKFALASRWIPTAAEFSVAVDVPRALANPLLRDGLSRMVQGGQGVTTDLVAALLERQSVVGMLLLVGTLREPNQTPLVAVVAQGNFDRKTFIPAIRTILASGKSGLTAEDRGERTLYLESDERDPFGFMLLDGRHLAVGTRESLVELFPEQAAASPVSPAAPDTVLFGRFAFGPRIKNLLPPGLVPISAIDFGSGDGQTLTATINSGTPGEAASTQMFLEGVRALLLLQQEGNTALTGIFKGIAIENRGSEIVLSCDLLPLVGLWSATEAEETAE